MDNYVKTALAGSIVGAMIGGTEMIPAKGLARAALEFGGGTAESAVGQLILDGEVDAEQMFKEGLLAMGMAEVGRWLRGGEVGEGNADTIKIGKKIWMLIIQNGKYIE